MNGSRSGDQLLPLVPILKEVGAQSVPGTRPGVLDVSAAGRSLKVGDVICFELAYDKTVYDVVRGGAQVMMVQSNNATYGGTGQIEQQFAITRARAMEARREIAVATTNSVSGFIDRDGRVVAAHQLSSPPPAWWCGCRCVQRSPRPSGSRRGSSAGSPLVAAARLRSRQRSAGAATGSVGRKSWTVPRPNRPMAPPTRWSRQRVRPQLSEPTVRPGGA